MSFDFSALLAPKRTKLAEPVTAELVAVGSITPAEPMPTIMPPPEVIGLRLSESEILELWGERSCIIHEANVELVKWCDSQGFTVGRTWRYCELCAAAGMSLDHGTYVEAIIRPKIAPEND